MYLPGGAESLTSIEILEFICNRTDFICNSICTSFSLSLSFSVPGRPVRLRGGAHLLPVAVEQLITHLNRHTTWLFSCFKWQTDRLMNPGNPFCWKRKTNIYNRQISVNGWKWLSVYRCVLLVHWRLQNDNGKIKLETKTHIGPVCRAYFWMSISENALTWLHLLPWQEKSEKGGTGRWRVLTWCGDGGDNRSDTSITVEREVSLQAVHTQTQFSLSGILVHRELITSSSGFFHEE